MWVCVVGTYALEIHTEIFKSEIMECLWFALYQSRKSNGGKDRWNRTGKMLLSVEAG